MPDGGIVTTYTDITASVEAAEALPEGASRRRGPAEGGLLPGVHRRPARRHRQPRRRRRRAAARRGRHDGDDPTSSSPPTRARRRSATSPTRSRAEYGFWLGDAFASGGSVGYDHKAMGITARGAWESVRRHARVLGNDADSRPAHRRRHRRHVRRRVRQRDAALAGTAAGRRVRPPPRLPRSRSRPGDAPSPNARGCSSCRVRRGPTTTAR